MLFSLSYASAPTAAGYPPSFTFATVPKPHHDGTMSVSPALLSAPPDVRPDTLPPQVASGDLGSRAHLPMPQIRECSPSPGHSRPPSPTLPQDHHHLSHPSLDLTRPDSSASTTSSETLSGTPLSPSADIQGTILGGPLVAEPESTSSVIEPESSPQAGQVWLAPSPVTFFTSMRYSRPDKLNYDKVKPIDMVPPLNDIQPRPNTLGKLGWRPYEHPEGSVYFRSQNFYTNSWLYEEPTLKAIEEVVGKLRAALTEHPRLASRDIEFAIDLIDDEEPDANPGDKLGCYYAADKGKEEVFWLHEVHSSFFCDGAEMKVISREHMGYGARMGYWDHVYMFPHGRSVPPETVANLRATISYQMFDKETSKSSTSPYSSDDAHRLLQALKEIEHYAPEKDVRPEHIIMTARMFFTLYREKLLRFHGERYAQLDCDRTVFEEAPSHHHHSKIFSVCSWLFFLTPHLYLERLRHTWVDNKINYDHWNHFISELQEDWAASITPSTIILSANVGFLAIQSVDQGGVAAPDRTMAQIISYISTLLSLGNIVACTILSAQHRKSTHRYTENAIAYLCSRALSRRGMENLAVIFSIPAAFFLWGLVTFFIALYWVCMHHTSGITRIAVNIIAAVSILLLAVVLYNSDWKSQPSINSIATKMQKMQGMVKRAPTSVGKRLKTLSRSLTQSARTTLAYVPRRRKTRYPGSGSLTMLEEGRQIGLSEMQ
ncbi:hypothetical protein GSI_14781 [Ganoderma sinense ZZ0214-1]|uniref:WW domain-containing protein n=1 Tax=Ganoderma sinense ZZ0214-1 TaxID=1077348 RepID=A0A2G8RPN0_9APHY|nr:hypothetical protein GSI_14781 [Ganoderma sinense ZZ0214-1]